MASSLILTAPGALSAPLPGTPKLRLVGDNVVLVRDTYNRANSTNLSGQTTEAGSGYSALAYSGSPNGFAINSQRLGPSAAPGAYFVGVNVPSARPDSLVEATVAAVPAGGSVSLVLRRNTLSAATVQIRVTLASSGTASLNFTNPSNPGNTSSTIHPGSGFGYTAGDRIGLREYNGLVEIYKNGALVYSWANLGGFPDAPWAGFATSGATATGWALDDFVVTETIR